MNSKLIAFICVIIQSLQAEDEYFEVSGPFVVNQGRVSKQMVYVPSWLDGQLDEAELAFDDGIHSVSDLAESGISEVKADASKALNATKQYIGDRSTDISRSVSKAVSTVGNKLKGAANQTKIFILKSSNEAKGFFSSTFSSATEWFSKLEDEAKELIHFVLRVIEIVAVLVILVIFLWIFKRVATGYRFLKGVAESFEMGERSGVHTV